MERNAAGLTAKEKERMSEPIKRSKYEYKIDHMPDGRVQCVTIRNQSLTWLELVMLIWSFGVEHEPLRIVIVDEKEKHD